MGTRCLVHIKSEGLNSPTLVTLYRQYDGYPNGIGRDIQEILGDGKGKILNGFGSQDTPEFFNGMGCLAAWVIKELKERIGNVYIYPPDSEGCGEEYTYIIYKTENNDVVVRCLNVIDNVLSYHFGKN